MDTPFRQYLGWERFPENLTDPEVAHFFSLSEDERRAVHRRRRPLNRLGVALQVGFLRLTGAPLNSVEMIPPQVLAHLGTELGIASPRLASIRALYRRHRTLFEHQDAAKRALGLRDLTEHGERALNGFLRREAGDKFLVDELEPAARAWLRDHHKPDREAAFGGYRAATLMLLKRSLRNGQASVAHSLEHRAPEDRLIPKAQWRKERARFVRNLAVSAKPEATIHWIKDELAIALKAIDAAVSRGDIRIENDRLVVPKLKAAPEDARLKAIRHALFLGAVRQVARKRA